MNGNKEDNRENNYEKMEETNIQLKKASSKNFNHLGFQRARTSKIVLKRAQAEAQEILKEESINKLMKEKLIFNNKM